MASTSTDRFRALVDRTCGSLDGDLGLEDLYAHFGLSSTDGYYSSSAVVEHLRDQIISRLFTSIRPPADAQRSILSSIYRQLLLEHFADDVEILAHFSVVSLLTDYRPKSMYPADLDDESAWVAAIQAVKDVLHLQPQNHLADEDFLRFVHGRVLRQAIAVRVLRGHGYPIKTRDGDVTILEDEQTRLFARFDDLAASLGGTGLITNILRQRASSYDLQMERYLLPRRTDGRRPAADPIGYLINLALRHTESGSQALDPNAAFNELLNLTSAYCALHDLESYNVLDTIVYSLDGLLELAHRLALYDSLFGLVQWRWSDLPWFLNELFACVSGEEATAALGMTITEATQILRAIGTSSTGPPDFSVSLFDAPGVKLQLGLHTDEQQITRLFSELTAPAPNTAFLAPEDQQNAEILEYPFIRAEGALAMLPPPLAAPAVFNAVCNSIHRVVPDVHTRLGSSFEDLVEHLLAKAGVGAVRGYYTAEGKRLECDLVVETSTTIIFIELKKKILTRRARGGDIISVLCDLAASLFAAQLQLAVHEKNLRALGTLNIVDADGHKVAELERGERSIERVALSLQDFGALQDRSLIRDFLTYIPGIVFEKKDLPAQQATALTRLERICKDLVDVEKQIRPDDARGLWFPNASFLSLGNLSVMLDNVKSADDLLTELDHTRSINTGQYDFYSAYKYLRTLPSRRQV